MPDLAPEFLTRPIAHRGLHDHAAGRIENSPAAILAAIEAGYGIEVDVQVAADGAPVVFHDATLNRLTDRSGPVADLPSADLARVRLNGSDDTIPSLRAVLDMVGGRAPLLVELKDTGGPQDPETGPLPAAVAAILAGYAGPLAVMSFSPFMMRAFAAAAPDVPAGLVTMDYSTVPLDDAMRQRLSNLDDLRDIKAAFISCRWQDLDLGPVVAVRERGLPVLCWTILSAEQAMAARPKSENITFEGFLPAVQHPSL